MTTKRIAEIKLIYRRYMDAQGKLCEARRQWIKAIQNCSHTYDGGKTAFAKKRGGRMECSICTKPE